MATVVWFVLAVSACFAASDAQTGWVHEASDILGHRLFPVLSRSEMPNVLYSPSSLSSLMGMVYAGAAGNTKEELLRTLGYSEAGVAKDEVLDKHMVHNRRVVEFTNSSVSSANAAAVHSDFQVLPAYHKILSESFDAEVFNVDFKKEGEVAVRTINDWVSEHTKGLIATMFDQPLSSETKMVVLNAVYFKGLWATEFNQSLTEQLPFYNDRTQATQVDTMYGRMRAFFGSFDELDCDILDLPYKIADYSMTIMLPRLRDGIAKLRGMSRQSFSLALGNLKEKDVYIRLPKFKLEANYLLREPFQKLGMRIVFNRNKADLSGVTGQKGLYLSDVIHKAVIEVDEEGTKAAAVSASFLVGGFVSDVPARFFADHPFMFCIRSKSHGVLFMGEVNRL